MPWLKVTFRQNNSLTAVSFYFVRRVAREPQSYVLCFWDQDNFLCVPLSNERRQPVKTSCQQKAVKVKILWSLKLKTTLPWICYGTLSRENRAALKRHWEKAKSWVYLQEMFLLSDQWQEELGWVRRKGGNRVTMSDVYTYSLYSSRFMSTIHTNTKPLTYFKIIMGTNSGSDAGRGDTLQHVLPAPVFQGGGWNKRHFWYGMVLRSSMTRHRFAPLSSCHIISFECCLLWIYN